MANLEFELVSPQDFKLIAKQWLTGVAVVTARDRDGQLFGSTMNAISALSLEPPQFLICVDKGSETGKAIRENGVFCINYLAKGQERLAAIFARRGPLKFDGVEYELGSNGAPILAGTLGFIECGVSSVHEGGDHLIVVGDVVRTEAREGVPLGYFRGSFCEIAA